MVAGNSDFAAMNTMLQTYQQAARQALSSADIYGFQVTNRVHSKKGYWNTRNQRLFRLFNRMTTFYSGEEPPGSL